MGTTEDSLVQKGTEPADEDAALDEDESSDGSELGSDLDDPEFMSQFQFPEIKNTLLVEIKRLNRAKRRWSIQVGRGVLTVDGKECLISSGRGTIEVDSKQSYDGDTQAD